MSVYAFTNILLMERTARLTCTVGALAANAVTIPTITVSGKTIRPIGFSIIDASANFNLKLGTATDLGDAAAITAADLSAANQPAFNLGATDIIVLSDGLGTTTVDVRWFWPNQARDGVALGTAYGSLIPKKTEAATAGAVEAALAIPTGAVELVILSLSTDSLLYRVDDGVANGQQHTVESAHLSYAIPYSIFVNDGDRLRIQRSGGSDVDIVGYWRLER